jgi:hypothetical protein
METISNVRSDEFESVKSPDSFLKHTSRLHGNRGMEGNTGHGIRGVRALSILLHVDTHF